MLSQPRAVPDQRASPQPLRSDYPAVSSILAAMLARAAGPRFVASPEECALFTACEFWATAMGHELYDFLRPDPVRRLWAAQAAFNAIGAKNIALLLAGARLELSASASREITPSLVFGLEAKLAGHDHRVDELIGSFAMANLDEATAIVRD